MSPDSGALQQEEVRLIRLEKAQADAILTIHFNNKSCWIRAGFTRLSLFGSHSPPQSSASQWPAVAS